MARLVIFLSLLTGLVLILTMGNYQRLPVSNKYFSLAAVEKDYHNKQLIAAQLAKAGVHGEEVVEEEAPAEAPKVTLALDTEELKNGHAVYSSKGKCVTCHGSMGEGKKSQQAPRIAGQYDWYLYEQLVAMKNKVRENKKMEPYLRNLGEKDFKDVAHYLSKLPPH